MLRTSSWIPNVSSPASLRLTVRSTSLSSPATLPVISAFSNAGSSYPYVLDASFAVIVTSFLLIVTVALPYASAYPYRLALNLTVVSPTSVRVGLPSSVYSPSLFWYLISAPSRLATAVTPYAVPS